ncbi:phage tail assembly chaperone [Piscinibacter koreensis]|uniref:Phage tail assembly chaperone n=1 Tax=Piscinibacter koreensis TaxID=2742824 RepID=A0A7Y6NQR6_9BURK|nr:phage tail assembly chaperone [Schlegelella koreensis]NUZ07613.1 hypothetical protein [Schlegelella koreensis]
MPKLLPVPSATFKAKVPVPVAGGKATDVEMTFRHRRKTDLDAFVSSRSGKSDVESFLEMVTGWELDDPFDSEHVEELLENYPGAAVSAFETYMHQLVHGGGASAREVAR